MSNSPVPAEAMGIGNMLDNKNTIQNGQGVVGSHLDLPRLGVDRAGSPHGSEHKYTAALNGLAGVSSYPSPAPLQAAPMHIPGSNAAQMPGGLAFTGLPNAGHYQSPVDGMNGGQPPAPKQHPCRTCGKFFARRSDLSRHERIHSGHRPHVCDFEGCGKQFIQRSALTVHQRTHTGEKPHMCEKCTKSFGDSSSLARHRRIHSGKRPYKCPYADCQKTFTRRTTLTRHQNHHTGTVEEAARATAQALARGATSVAARASSARPTLSEGDQLSNQGSPLATPSPAQRNMSMSPGAEMAMTNMQAYMNSSSLPSHLRNDLHAAGSPNSTTSSAYTSNNMRPTSHPSGYGPPQTLEPSIEQGPGSAGGSPHLGSTGWQSPSHMASPTHSNGGNSYVYPDPETYPASAALGQMFYNGASGMRRPGSAEPGTGSYDVKSRTGELWAAAAQ